MRVYGVVRLTAGKLLAAVTVCVCLLLAVDAWRTAHAEPEPVLATDFDRALWLKENGVEVDPEPVWTKEVFFADPPEGETLAYLEMLEKQGFTPRAHLGRTLTCTCFRAADGSNTYARVLTDGDTLVGADRFVADPDAAGYLPIRA